MWSLQCIWHVVWNPLTGWCLQDEAVHLRSLLHFIAGADQLFASISFKSRALQARTPAFVRYTTTRRSVCDQKCDLWSELWAARSRLYRSRFLQVNTRWKALAEIYTMHSFAPFSNLKIFVKKCCFFFLLFSQKFANFARILLNVC